MFLLIACIAPDDETEAPVEAPVEPIDVAVDGVQTGEFIAGFGSIHYADPGLTVVLTTYADPCTAQVGYLEELTAFLRPNPYAYGSDEWDKAVNAAADRWLPADPYDTLVLEFTPEGDRIGEYEVNSGLPLDRSAVAVALELGRTPDHYDLLSSLWEDQHISVTSLDPVIGEGEADLEGRISGTTGDVSAWVDLRFEVPTCDEWLPARVNYENAMPDGC